MFSLLAFIFSPCGRVGRGAWWITQLSWVILVISLVLALGESFIPMYKHAEAYGKELRVVRGVSVKESTPQEKTWEEARIKADLEQQSGKLWTIGILLLVGLWCCFVVEVKRWHDLGMSGAWVLLHLVPLLSLLMLPFVAAKWVNFGVGLMQLIFLGFWRGMYFEVARARDLKGRHETEPDAPGFAQSLVVLGVIIAVLVTAVAARMGASWTKGMVDAKVPLITPVEVPDAAVVVEEKDFHGTAETQFAKDWVMIDGEKVEGISSVLPAAGGKVCLVYAGGGKSARAAALPQGFLDDWKITPERLKAANGP